MEARRHRRGALAGRRARRGARPRRPCAPRPSTSWRAGSTTSTSATASTTAGSGVRCRSARRSTTCCRARDERRDAAARPRLPGAARRARLGRHRQHQVARLDSRWRRTALQLAVEHDRLVPRAVAVQPVKSAFELAWDALLPAGRRLDAHRALVVRPRADPPRRGQHRRRRPLAPRPARGARTARHGWVRWELPWTPPPGRHELLARATDRSGLTQPDTRAVQRRRLPVLGRRPPPGHGAVAARDVRGTVPLTLSGLHGLASPPHDLSRRPSRRHRAGRHVAHHGADRRSRAPRVGCRTASSRTARRRSRCIATCPCPRSTSSTAARRSRWSPRVCISSTTAARSRPPGSA